ncbi:MAG TPA: hypothetical protein VFV99_16105 [Kofleriaceae bacterium]|nr:hypothetical protein [Kofleriaceae bacterium]
MGLAPEDWEEHTEIVPRVVLARRRRAVTFLAFAAFAFSVGAASFVIPKKRRVEQATKDAITADAQKLAVNLHAAFNQTQDRAEGFAGTPVLEAGILTDAATVADIVKTEYRLKTRPGETLELFQLKGETITPLVRVPADAAPIAYVKGKRTRIENRKGLAVVVSAEVAPYNSTTDLSGQLAVAAAVDLSQLPLSAHSVEANLVGAGPPIPLVAKRGTGDSLTVPVPLDAKWELGQLSLHAVPVMSPYLAGWVLPLRYGALGLGIAFLCTFLVAFRGALRR